MFRSVSGCAAGFVNAVTKHFSKCDVHCNMAFGSRTIAGRSRWSAAIISIGSVLLRHFYAGIQRQVSLSPRRSLSIAQNGSDFAAVFFSAAARLIPRRAATATVGVNVLRMRRTQIRGISAINVVPASSFYPRLLCGVEKHHFIIFVN